MYDTMTIVVTVMGRTRDHGLVRIAHRWNPERAATGCAPHAVVSDEPPAKCRGRNHRGLQRGRTQQAEADLAAIPRARKRKRDLRNCNQPARGGHCHGARQCILRAMELEPSNPKFLLAASNIAQDLCEDDEALELAHAAMVADPAGAEVHCHAGVLHLLKGILKPPRRRLSRRRRSNPVMCVP